MTPVYFLREDLLFSDPFVSDFLLAEFCELFSLIALWFDALSLDLDCLDDIDDSLLLSGTDLETEGAFARREVMASLPDERFSPDFTVPELIERCAPPSFLPE